MPLMLTTAAKSLGSCPTLQPRPRDSPGKNTGVGCHVLLPRMKVKVKSLSRVRLSGTPWTAAHQAPPSMGFSRQEHWSGGPVPSPDADNWSSPKKEFSQPLKCSTRSLQGVLPLAPSASLSNMNGQPRKTGCMRKVSNMIQTTETMKSEETKMI